MDAKIENLLPIDSSYRPERGPLWGQSRHHGRELVTSGFRPKNEPALAGWRWPGGRVHWVYRSNHLNGAQVTGGRSVLRIEGFKHSNLKTGAPNEREAHQPAASAHDRRHDGAKLRREDAQRLYPAR